jgi:hypothetical protein
MASRRETSGKQPSKSRDDAVHRHWRECAPDDRLAKQSITRHGKLDCFVASAPRNDGMWVHARLPGHDGGGGHVAAFAMSI